jgi:hypothetical protein
MGNLVKWLRSNLDPRLRHSRTSLEFGFFLPEAKSSASIIRATCTFDTKKVLEYRFVILLTRCQQDSYKLFENFDFCSEVSAFLIDFSLIFYLF